MAGFLYPKGGEKIAQSVKIDGLEHLQEDLKKLAEELPELRREAHERLAGQMLLEVRKNLSQRAEASSGTAAGWQESYVGTKGGYAAVRPKAGEFVEYKSTKYAVGYITNAIENGHAIRRPSGSWKHYRARIKRRYVLGLKFYQQTGGKLEKMAIEEANRLADSIQKSLTK